MTGKRRIDRTIARNIDEYLSKVSTEQRMALEKLRRAIKAGAPNSEECISYQIPSFRLDGRMLVSFAAWKNHCAFYPGSHAIRVHKSALKAFDTDKGTIRFPTNKPLSTMLVKRLVKTRKEQLSR